MDSGSVPRGFRDELCPQIIGGFGAQYNLGPLVQLWLRHSCGLAQQASAWASGSTLAALVWQAIMGICKPSDWSFLMDSWRFIRDKRPT